MTKIVVGPGYVSPDAYEVDADGCHIWTRATVNGRPVVMQKMRSRLVRRQMTPDLAPNEIIRASCGKRLCVNPAHFIRERSRRVYERGRATGRGLLDENGRPKPESYEVNERGCHLWKGQCSRSGHPLAVYRGERVSVRQVLLRGRPGSVIRSTCGENRCVNARHLYKPNEVHEWRVARHARSRTAEEQAKGLDELRDLRWIRQDLASLLAKDPDNHAGVTANARWALEQYANGHTLQAMANVAGVTKQALSIQIKLADRRLRKHIAGDPLQ